MTENELLNEDTTFSPVNFLLLNQPEYHPVFQVHFFLARVSLENVVYNKELSVMNKRFC